MKKILFAILFLFSVSVAEAETITITVNADQYAILDQFAKANGLSLQEYVANIVKSWADSHITGFYVDEIKSRPFAELKQLLGDINIKGRER